MEEIDEEGESFESSRSSAAGKERILRGNKNATNNRQDAKKG